MEDPTTLEDILAPLEGESRAGALDTILAVGANLAIYFGELVEPALDTMVASLSWKRRAALANALGHVERTPKRAEVLARLLADRHPDVSAEALLAYREGPTKEALEPLRALAAKGLVHVSHVHALEAAADARDLSLFSALARSRKQELAIAAINAMGALETFDGESLEALVGALATRATRVCAADVLVDLSAASGPAALHAALHARPGALDLLDRMVERVDPHVQPTLRSIVAPTPPAPPATTKPAPSPPPATQELAGYGTILDGTRREHGIRIGDDGVVEEVARMLTAPERGSVVLVGPSGVGKTSVVHAVARHLRAGQTPWVVLETSSAEVLAGTKFLGEWETRLKRLIDLAKAPARVVLYFADVHTLASQGRSAQRDASFADFLAPYLDRGELAILGEATDDSLTRGIDRHEAMRRIFERVRIHEMTPAESAAVVRGRLAYAAERDRTSYAAPPAIVDQIVETASLYASGAAHPGAAARLADQIVELLREKRRAGGAADAEPIESSDVILALSRSTGMPGTLLDDRAPFDRAAVRAFFEERVLGQPEAVDVVVELVTLVKAGLTDPDRPYGSLFFVGPTGVGKTELAKALAEHLYGTADRMVRVDMSELREWDSHERLIGSLRNSEMDGFLTRRVAEQPFSVILLDEVEKAHPNVHDILLQLLDDGRLTDARGRTTDFRRTVIVMTSNVGSRVEIDALGFGATGGHAPSEEAVLREVRKVFRPELVNRFGRIVVFRPLAPETMRVLVRRELGKVVLRSGVLRRRLVIDLAPELVDLLAREGFSIAYGARPLKRRVERRVLLPIAERIVTLGPDTAGTILRAEADGDRVVVRAIAPQTARAEAGAAKPRALEERTWTKAKERLVSVTDRLRAISEHPSTMEAEQRRSELLARTGQLTFWDDPEQARAALTELADLDDRSSARATLERRIEGVAETTRELSRSRGRSPATRMHEALDEIERDLALLEHRTFVEERLDGADVILTLARLGTSARAAELLELLVETYEAWARAHDAAVTRLDEASDAHGPTTTTLHLEGHGLYGRFRGEAGLHRLPDKGRGKDRITAVVRASVLPSVEAPLEGVTVTKSAKKGRARVTLVHAPTGTALEAEVPKSAGDAIERLLRAWLRARIDHGAASTRDALVRSYRVEDKYAADEDTGERFRMKTLATEGLDAIFAARARARLEEARGATRAEP